MSKEDDTLEKDAENFRYHLINRINSDDDGEKIKNYLNVVVPDWYKMRPTRLYKHIQKMFENSEGIRRYEIDLIWKRVLYFIPLLVVSFSAFGFGLAYFQEEKYFWLPSPISLFNITPEGTVLLILLAFLNFAFSIFLAVMNAEGQKWQENWEYHVDYLQAILGLTLMRTCLRKRTSYLTIARSNNLVGVVISVIWLELAFFLIVGCVFSISYILIKIILVILVIILAIVIFLFSLPFLYCVVNKESLCKISKPVKKTKFSYFRPLKDLQIGELDSRQNNRQSFWDEMKKCYCCECCKKIKKCLVNKISNFFEGNE